MLLRRLGTEEPQELYRCQASTTEEEMSLSLLGRAGEGKKIKQLKSGWVANWDSEPGVLPPTQPPAPTAARASYCPLHLLKRVELEEFYKK